MSTGLFQIFRLVLAGINGLMFAAGTFYLYITLIAKPKRWRHELAQLIVEADREETENVDSDSEYVSELRIRIDVLRYKIKHQFKIARNRFNLILAILVVVISIFAIVSLITQPAQMFGRI